MMSVGVMLEEYIGTYNFCHSAPIVILGVGYGMDMVSYKSQISYGVPMVLVQT